MYQSIPSVNIPQANPTEIFEVVKGPAWGKNIGKSTKIFFVYICDQQVDVVMTKHGDTFDLVGFVDIGEEELALRTLISVMNRNCNSSLIYSPPNPCTFCKASQ